MAPLALIGEYTEKLSDSLVIVLKMPGKAAAYELQERTRWDLCSREPLWCTRKGLKIYLTVPMSHLCAQRRLHPLGNIQKNIQIP
jgi:hypothetical protein